MVEKMNTQEVITINAKETSCQTTKKKVYFSQETTTIETKSWKKLYQVNTNPKKCSISILTS